VPWVLVSDSQLTQASPAAAILRSWRAQSATSKPPMSQSGGVRNGSTPTVLLVHGAFADGWMWAEVIAELQAAGIEAIAPANPLRGLGSDAGHVAWVAGEIDGPVILAGHCYAGAVITAAASAARNVVGLVYVAAFAPDEGESVLDICRRFPCSCLMAVLRPASFPGRDGDPGVELYIDREAFPRVFAADLPHRAAAAAASAQRPVTAAAFEEKVFAAAWKTMPCWYLIATDDQLIPPEAQRFMARRAGAHIAEIRASHAIALSQPAAVAEQIAAAAASRGRPEGAGQRQLDRGHGNRPSSPEPDPGF
jgi:pimeloyl-ACP methyl ester carboxylesterase